MLWCLKTISKSFFKNIKHESWLKEIFQNDFSLTEESEFRWNLKHRRATVEVLMTHCFQWGHHAAHVCPVYLKEWKSSFFLGFLQARWGSTAVLSCRGLWEHFLLSNRSILPTCIVSLWVLPSWLYKHSTRWNHCLSFFWGIKGPIC